MWRQTYNYIILSCTIFVFLVACGNETGTTPTTEPQEQVAESVIALGELQKLPEGNIYGQAFQESITVRNCNNPLSRSDNLTEAKTVSRNINWSIVGEVGGEVEAGVVLAKTSIQAAVSSGYELEVSDALQRSRTLDLPVSPNSSVEYIIEWKPIIWIGFIPFTFQGGAARIEYLYEYLAFGEVVEVNDKTVEHCENPNNPDISTSEPEPPPPPTDEPDEIPTSEPEPPPPPTETSTPEPDTPTPTPTSPPTSKTNLIAQP